MLVSSGLKAIQKESKSKSPSKNNLTTTPKLNKLSLPNSLNFTCNVMTVRNNSLLTLGVQLSKSDNMFNTKRPFISLNSWFWSMVLMIKCWKLVQSMMVSTFTTRTQLTLKDWLISWTVFFQQQSRIQNNLFHTIWAVTFLCINTHFQLCYQRFVEMIWS